MSNCAIVQFSPSTQNALISMKCDPQIRALKLAIENETLEDKETIHVSGDVETDFNALAEHVSETEPCFFIIRLGKSVEHLEFLFLVFIPSRSPVRAKTIAASARLPIQRQISTTFNGMADYFVDSIKEINWQAYRQIAKHDETAYSNDELMLRQERAESTVAQVQLPAHDSFTWPVSDDLKEALGKFKDGQGPRIVGGASDPQGHGVVLAECVESVDDLPQKEPRYLAIRANDGPVFVLFCPDTAKSRDKMMSSTCKHTFMVACEGLGLEFEKQFDIRDARELSEAHLKTLIHPVEVDHGYGDVKVFQKPRRPGRPSAK